MASDEYRVRLEPAVKRDAKNLADPVAKMSEEKLLELTNYLDQKIEDCRMRRAVDLEDIDTHRGVLTGKRKNAALRRGMSNISVPLTIWASAAVRARVEQSVMDAKPLLVIIPAGKTKGEDGTDYNQVCADLGRWLEVEFRSPRALDGEEVTRRAVAELVNFGPCAAKVYREIPQLRVLPNSTGSPETTEVSAGRIRWAHIGIEDLLWCDGYGTDTQAMPIVGHEFDRTWSAIKAMEAMGYYDPAMVARVEHHFTTVAETPPAPLRVHRIAEIYLDYAIDDTFYPVPLTVDWHLDARLPLWVRWNTADEGRRPIFMANFDVHPDLKKAKAQGLCDKLRGAQDETDVIHNLGIEATKRAIAHLTVLKADSGAEDDLGGAEPVLPGDKVVTQSPGDDITTVPLGDPKGVEAWLVTEQNTLHYVFRMLGFDESGLGKVEAGKRVPASLGLTSIREGRVITKQPINSLSRMLTDMLYHTIALYRDAMPIDTLYTVLEPASADAIRDILFTATVPAVRSQFVITVNAQDAATVQETRKQELIVVNQLLGMYYDKLMQYAQMALQVPAPLNTAIVAVMEKMENAVRTLLTTIDAVPNPDDVLIRVDEYMKQLGGMTMGMTPPTTPPMEGRE